MDGHPDNKAGRPNSHHSDEAIPEKVEALCQFIDDTQELLEKVVPGINAQICESFHSRKAKSAPKDCDWQGSWKARVTSTVFDTNRPEWRIELYYRLPLPVLCRSVHEAIVSHDEVVMAKATKRNIPSEQRKSRLARGLRGNHTIAIEDIDPKHKGLVKQKVHNLSNTDHEQYDKLVAQLMQEENDEMTMILSQRKKGQQAESLMMLCRVLVLFD
jgi:hypothetical protein